MDADAIRAFAARRWDLVEHSKVRARAERFRAGGSAACLRAAAELRGRWYRLHPERPSHAARKADFEHHLAMSRKLARVGDADFRR
jgi:hypothetical protein